MNKKQPGSEENLVLLLVQPLIFPETSSLPSFARFGCAICLGRDSLRAAPNTRSPDHGRVVWVAVRDGSSSSTGAWRNKWGQTVFK